MGTKTGIEWTDSTWSPIRFRVRSDAAQIAKEKGYGSLFQIAGKMAGHVGQHCEHVSPGCLHCYAGANNHRCLPANGTGLPYDRRSRDLVEPFIDEKVLLQPIKWRPIKMHTTECEKRGKRGLRQGSGRRGGSRYGCDCPTRPRRIFVENQSDLFGEWVTEEMIDRIFAMMALCGQHTFQVLTKRPAAMYRYMTQLDEENKGDFWRGAMIEGATQALYSRLHPEISHESISMNLAVHLPLPNVWLGVSAENQVAADERIPLLLQTPAAVRFISAEPLLGPVELSELPSASGIGRHLDSLSNAGVDRGALIPSKLDWVICGGESGPGAREMKPEWTRSIRDQCKTANVAFFIKQMGSVYGPHKGHELPADLNIKQFPRRI
jgi:protein gp37